VYSDMLFFLFFFSSRRRHTRSTRDWSSDVCSSDLHRSHSIRYLFSIQLLREGMRAMLRTLHESTGQRFRTANNVSIRKAISAKANRLAYRRRARESPTRGRAARIPAIVVTVAVTT